MLPLLLTPLATWSVSNHKRMVNPFSFAHKTVTSSSTIGWTWRFYYNPMFYHMAALCRTKDDATYTSITSKKQHPGCYKLVRMLLVNGNVTSSLPTPRLTAILPLFTPLPDCDLPRAASTACRLVGSSCWWFSPRNWSMSSLPLLGLWTSPLFRFGNCLPWLAATKTVLLTTDELA